MTGRTPRLNETDVLLRLSTVPGWEVREGALHRELRFDSFPRAFGFMASVAVVAQELDHHPEWSNVYDRVTIRLRSHDVDGISDRDFALAVRINDLLD